MQAECVHAFRFSYAPGLASFASVSSTNVGNILQARKASNNTAELSLESSLSAAKIGEGGAFASSQMSESDLAVRPGCPWVGEPRW